MIDALFTVALLAIFILTMWFCYESWQPKPYPKYFMIDQAKRWGHK